MQLRVGISLGAIATAIMWAGAAAAQVAEVSPEPQAAEDAEAVTQPSTTSEAAEEEVVVRGFRGSLASALRVKRNETAAVDSILSEDIGKFPDSNLAESMQRIPGVALARGDGGEGRNISVRGLGSQFTRVRINGMEGSSQTGSSDIFGAGNSGRSFDFNVFPTEIFSALTVRKTPSADVEEGSLGATVDLAAPKPLSGSQEFVLSATARGVWNELSKKVDPRVSFLAAKQFDDGRFGILGSFAYQKRNIREVGYAAVDILSANSDGGFCSPVGYAPQNPANNILRGTTTLNCSTDNPRTSTPSAYDTIRGLVRPDLATTPGSGAFLPRIPRYVNSEQDQKRLGGTLTFQLKPDDHTDMSIDLLYSKFNVERRDNYIGLISFGRSATNLGKPMTSVRDIEFDSLGSLVHGTFDGVDVRSEGLVDRFSSTFKQVDFNLKRQIGETLELTTLIGFNRSNYNGTKRLQTFMDAIDADGVTINFRDGNGSPRIGYGIDVSNPASFIYGPALANGTVRGGFSFQDRPARNITENLTAEANLQWTMTPELSLKFGGQYRSSDFKRNSLRPYAADLVVTALPAGTTLDSITRQITGVGDLWGNGAPDAWAAIDPDKWGEVFNVEDRRFCGVECGGTGNRVNEQVKSAYAMAVFNLSERLGFGVRGDVGVRYAHTDLLASAHITLAPRPGVVSPTNLVGQYLQRNRTYKDWLPSGNLVIEPVEDLLFRFSAAKVMARPELTLLPPTTSITATTRNGTINNPFLDPIRAKTFDAAVEWYFRPGSLLSAAFFYKDISTYIQNISSQIPFDQLNLPTALLANTNTAPTEIFTITQPSNTPGGPLKGFELNAQVRLDFLPGFLRNLGVLANYTRVKSKIDYCLASVGGNCTVGTTNDLVGLSKNTASGTLYYEDERFSIRGTANYRDRFIRGIPASPGSDLQGNAPTLFLDASASYGITDQIRLIVEAQNLTDERNTLYIDSKREDTLFDLRTGRTVMFGASYKF